MQYFELIAYIVGGYVLVNAVALFVLWVLFLAVMNLQRAAKVGRLVPVAKVLGTPVLFVGYVLDFILNVELMTVVCLELPREATISARLKRYNSTASEWAWRRKVAAWFEPLLDPYDYRGDHI